MEHASTNHQLHGQSYMQQCIISIQFIFVKTAQNQPICLALCGLQGMHPEMQLMSQACQAITTHPQGKLTMQAAIITSMDRCTHHNVSFMSSAYLPNLAKNSPSNGYC